MSEQRDLAVETVPFSIACSQVRSAALRSSGFIIETTLDDLADPAVGKTPVVGCER